MAEQRQRTRAAMRVQQQPPPLQHVETCARATAAAASSSSSSSDATGTWQIRGHAAARTTTGRRTTTTMLSTLLVMLLALLWAPLTPATADDPVAPPGCSAAAGTCVRIGYFLCPWGGPQCSNVVGHDLMVEWYRNRVATKLGGKLGGVPVYWVRATISGFFAADADEVYETVDRLFIGDAARSGTGSPLVDFVILPFGSLWDTAMQLMEKHHIPSVGALSPDSKLFQCGPTTDVWNVTQPGCTAPNTRRYKYAHGAPNPGEQYFQPWVGLLKLRKAKSIAIVRTVVPFYQTIRAGLLTAAADNAIPIVYDELVHLNTAVTPAVLEASTVARVVSELEEVAADGLVLDTQDCVPWIEEMERRDFAPKSVAAVLCSDGSTPLAKLGHRLRYVVGSAQWAPEMKGADYSESADLQPWALFPHTVGGTSVGVSSPLQFQRLFRELLNSSTIVPGYAEAAVLVPFTFLEGAISLAGSVHPELVQAELLAYYQPSFYGLITTNRFGQNEQKQLIINQRDELNALHIISPTAVSTNDFIYPMPRFSERFYVHRLLSSTVEQVLVLLIALCCIFTGGLMLYLYRNRQHQVFQAAGLPFYLLQGLGCLCAYASVLTWGVENNSATCSARIWVWTGAFHLFVDPLLASSYRIARILQRKLGVVRISNAQLGGLCVALVAPQLLLNALWTGIAPMQPEVMTRDPLRPAHTSFTNCSSSSSGTVFLSLTLAYSCLLLLLACLLAHRVRGAWRLFNDARPIAVTVYLFAMTTAVVLVVQAALDHDNVADQRVLFGLRSVGMLVAYQGSIGLLYIRRILDARNRNGAVARYRGPITFAPRSDVAPDRDVQMTASPDAPMRMQQARVGGSDSTVGLHGGSLDLHGPQLSTSSLAIATRPLPPREDLLSLSTEEAVSLVEQYYKIIQMLRASAAPRPALAIRVDPPGPAPDAAVPVARHTPRAAPHANHHAHGNGNGNGAGSSNDEESMCMPSRSHSLARSAVPHGRDGVDSDSDLSPRRSPSPSPGVSPSPSPSPSPGEPALPTPAGAVPE